MEFGLPAVLVISSFTLAVAGALLLLSWLLHRSPTALALWGVAFAMGAIATVLIAVRGNIADIWSIVAANTVLAGAYGLMWSGARKFESRKPSATARPLAPRLGSSRARSQAFMRHQPPAQR